MNLKTFIPILFLIFIVCLLLIPTDRILSQPDPERNCATRVTDFSYPGSLLFLEDRKFFFTNQMSDVTEFMSAPYSFEIYFDPLSLNLLFWVRGYKEEDIVDDIFLEDYSIDIWSMEIGQNLQTKTQIANSLRPIQWIRNGHFLFFDWLTEQFLTFSPEVGTFEVFATRSDFPSMRHLPSQFEFDYDLSFSPDGHYVAYETLSSEIVLWDVIESTEIWRSEEPRYGMTISSPAWNSDSTILAVALFVETEMQLFLINSRTGEQMQITKFSTLFPEEGAAPERSLTNVIWSPNDRYIAFTQQDRGIFIFDVATHTMIETCAYGIPVFWLASDNFLLLHAQGIKLIDIEKNEVYSVVDSSDFSYVSAGGWSPLTADELMKSINQNSD